MAIIYMERRKMSNKAVTVYAAALKRQKEEEERKPTRKSTRESTRVRDNPRDMPRDKSRDNSRDQARDTSRGKPRDNTRGKSRALPTRDEIQGFSFQLRDELRVKIQAEVPPQWQTELEETARELNVKKLELYRFIIGEFLGKVKRKNND